MTGPLSQRLKLMSEQLAACVSAGAFTRGGDGVEFEMCALSIAIAECGDAANDLETRNSARVLEGPWPKRPPGIRPPHTPTPGTAA